MRDKVIYSTSIVTPLTIRARNINARNVIIVEEEETKTLEEKEKKDETKSSLSRQARPKNFSPRRSCL